MTETLANGYSNESTHRQLFNEYQHDRVLMVFKQLCVSVLQMNVASALEGLRVNWPMAALPVIYNLHPRISLCAARYGLIVYSHCYNS